MFLEQDSDPALLFHGSFGFREVGQHVMPTGSGRPPRGDADEGAVQLSVGARDLRRRSCPTQPWLPMPRVRAGRSSSVRPAPEHGDGCIDRHIDYEPAGELKIGQVGIANLRVRTLDVARLADEMRDRVRARRSCSRAPPWSSISAACQRTPDVGDRARAARWRCATPACCRSALAYGTQRQSRQLAREARPAAAGEVPRAVRARDRPGARRCVVRRQRKGPAAEAATTRRRGGAAETGRWRTGAWSRPRRCVPGQQVYAENRDLTVVTAVGAGAEVIADGSIHIYGALRGRALAGAQGNEKARIFCREFHAELVAIAGHYKVLEDIPKELRGKAVQIWLDKEQLSIAALD